MAKVRLAILKVAHFYNAYKMETYKKPPLSYTEQVALLQSRGTFVPDIPRAERLLANISYYRLSPYMLPYKKKENGTIIDSFKEGTTWDMVV